VGVEVLLVLVIPIEFDPAGHRPILYRNVYTFRIGSHSLACASDVVRPPLIDPAVVFGHAAHGSAGHCASGLPAISGPGQNLFPRRHF
jgi:hypothetical protein